MSTFIVQLRNEVSRVAKREVRAEVAILRKTASESKSAIVALKRRVAELETAIRVLTRAASQPARKVQVLKNPHLRFRVAGFVTLRKRLDLSAAEMARLIGVSSQSIYSWEAGKSRPRSTQLKAIAELRKLGKKQAALLLQSR